MKPETRLDSGEGLRDPVWWLMVAAGVCAIVGSLGPWAQVVGVLTVSGRSREGWLTIGLSAGALVALAVTQFALRDRRIFATVLATVLGAATAGVAGYDWSKIDEFHTTLPGAGIVGLVIDTSRIVESTWGVWLAAGGGAALTIFGVVRLITLLRTAGTADTG